MGILLTLLLLLLCAPYAVAGESAIGWNNRGVDLYCAGKYTAAIKAYEKAIKINPRYMDAYSNRGVAYDAMNQPERAVVDYSHAIELNPRVTASYVNRGLAYTDLAKFNDAITDWNVVLKRSPRNADAYYRRGFCYQSLGSLDKALADYERACKYNPRLAKAVRNRDMIRKALAISPTAPTPPPSDTGFTPLPMEKISETMDGTSKLAARVERPDRDVEAPRSVPQSKSGAAATVGVTTGLVRTRPAATGPAAFCVSAMQHVVGNLCLSLGQWEAAADSYSHAINVNPNDQFAYYRRGNAYLKGGKKDLAMADYERALLVNPRFKPAISKRDKLAKGEVSR